MGNIDPAKLAAFTAPRSTLPTPLATYGAAVITPPTTLPTIPGPPPPPLLLAGCSVIGCGPVFLASSFLLFSHFDSLAA